MTALQAILDKASASPRALSTEELAVIVSLADPAERDAAYRSAYAVKMRHIGPTVSLRGLVEIGNICAKDCLYCGIRRSNAAIVRYRLDDDDVVRMAATCRDLGYASLVLQGGEIESETNTRYVERILNRIAPFNLGVTLSLGEQTDDVYRRWREAGATRYLLRIETSNPKRYAALHPVGHSWERRRSCLEALRRFGYQVGTGVMSALPGQTADELARDIHFFGETDADMIGMGPYIPHPDTPLGRTAPTLPNDERLRIALNMIAATRLYLHDVNIAATTALQALAADGRERGLLAGANVIMPNVTDIAYRDRYCLYEGKPTTDENAAETRTALERSLAVIGESPAYGRRGDSVHFFRRNAAVSPRQL